MILTPGATSGVVEPFSAPTLLLDPKNLEVKPYFVPFDMIGTRDANLGARTDEDGEGLIDRVFSIVLVLEFDTRLLLAMHRCAWLNVDVDVLAGVVERRRRVEDLIDMLE